MTLDTSEWTGAMVATTTGEAAAPDAASISPVVGTIYAVESDFGAFLGDVQFFKVDPDTGAAFDVIDLTLGGSHPMRGFDALEITSDGRFFALGGGGFAGGFFEIDQFYA